MVMRRTPAILGAVALLGMVLYQGIHSANEKRRESENLKQIEQLKQRSQERPQEREIHERLIRELRDGPKLPLCADGAQGYGSNPQVIVAGCGIHAVRPEGDTGFVRPFKKEG